MTLTEFLLARIAEDEAEWGFLADGRWASIAKRQIAECEAKRAIMRDKGLKVFIDPTGTQVSKFGHRILTYLATVYADHPDYDEAWKVEQ